MKPKFWHQRWTDNEIGFHADKPNGLMRAYFGELKIGEGGRVFVPLCGKSLDVGWLASQGYQVIGAELSELAIKALFEDLGVDPVITDEGAFRVYRTEGIEIYVGDFFDLDAVTLGPVDAAYDRAALIAMPNDMRARYADHLAAITARAPQFLLTVEYNPNDLKGPPFPVTEAEVRRLYEARFECRERSRRDIKGGLKGRCKADEVVWFLDPK